MDTSIFLNRDFLVGIRFGRNRRSGGGGGCGGCCGGCGGSGGGWVFTTPICSWCTVIYNYNYIIKTFSYI